MRKRKTWPAVSNERKPAGERDLRIKRCVSCGCAIAGGWEKMRRGEPLHPVCAHQIAAGALSVFPRAKWGTK